MFQIASQYDGYDFDEAKDQIDNQYVLIRGISQSQRHGGNFQTFIRAFEEVGWITFLIGSDNNTKTIHITEAGNQAKALLATTPDFLKAYSVFSCRITLTLSDQQSCRPRRNTES